MGDDTCEAVEEDEGVAVEYLDAVSSMWISLEVPELKDVDVGEREVPCPLQRLRGWVAAAPSVLGSAVVGSSASVRSMVRLSGEHAPSVLGVRSRMHSASTASAQTKVCA